MEESVKKLDLLFDRAETHLEALSGKVDDEYKSLNESQFSSAQTSSCVVDNVRGLRKELAELASEVQGIQKQQLEAMSMVEAQLGTLCNQFGELSGVVGQEQHHQQKGEADP